MDEKKRQAKTTRKKAQARAQLATLDAKSLEGVTGGADPSPGLPTGQRMH